MAVSDEPVTILGESWALLARSNAPMKPNAATRPGVALTGSRGVSESGGIPRCWATTAAGELAQGNLATLHMTPTAAQHMGEVGLAQPPPRKPRFTDSPERSPR